MKPVRRLTIIDAFFVLVLIGLTVAFYNVLKPFIFDIILAFIMANIFWKLFLFFRKIFRKRKGAASIVTVLLIIIVIGGALTFIIVMLTKEMAGGVASFKEIWPDLKDKIQGIQLGGLAQRIPILKNFINFDSTMELSHLIESALTESSQLLMQLASKSFSSISSFVLHLIFTFFILFFVFIDGPNLIARIKELIPLGDRETDELITKMGNMTKATIISTLIIGFIEAAFGGILFIIFRVPSPMMWSVVILFMSLIPLIGANIIIVPAGILTIISGRYAAGIILIALGIAGIAVTQNIIKPKLLGGRSGLHPMLVLLSTLGGIIWLGVIGFLIGPMVAALFIVIWTQFGNRFRRELESKNDESE